MNLVKHCLTKLFFTNDSEADKRIHIINKATIILPLCISKIITQYAYESYSKNKSDVFINTRSNIDKVIMKDNLMVTSYWCGGLDIWKIKTYEHNLQQCTNIYHINAIKINTSSLSFLTFDLQGNIVSCSSNIIKILDRSGNFKKELITFDPVHRIDFLQESIVCCSVEGKITIWNQFDDSNTYESIILPLHGTIYDTNYVIELKVLNLHTVYILMMISHESVYHVWNTLSKCWTKYQLSSYVSYFSKLYQIGDIITISLAYHNNACIDVIDVNTHNNLLTLKTQNMSCYNVIRHDDNYRIITGSLNGEIKIWNLEKHHNTMTKHLVFVCHLGGFFSFDDSHTIHSIHLLEYNKIAVHMNNKIKIISLESIKKDVKSIDDIFTENEVCDRIIESCDYIDKSFVVSNTILTIGVNNLCAWR